MTRETAKTTLPILDLRRFDAQKDEFEQEMIQWLREGKVKYREDVVEGLGNAVAVLENDRHSIATSFAPSTS